MDKSYVLKVRYVDPHGKISEPLSNMTIVVPNQDEAKVEARKRIKKALPHMAIRSLNMSGDKANVLLAYVRDPPRTVDPVTSVDEFIWKMPPGPRRKKGGDAIQRSKTVK